MLLHYFLHPPNPAPSHLLSVTPQAVPLPPARCSPWGVPECRATVQTCVVPYGATSHHMCDSGIAVSNFSKCQLTREPGWLVVPALGSDCGSGGTREGCQLSSHLYEPPARPTYSHPLVWSPDPSGHGALDSCSFLAKLPFLGLVEFARLRAWGGDTVAKDRQGHQTDLV